MGSVEKRIGLLVPSLCAGSSQNVWLSFVKTAEAENASLYVFPGGRLNAKADSENLRNSLYSLVNEENLDGCIIWSSAIKYTESAEDFVHFHAKFESLPYVTLGYKIPGHPCVEFDAYRGMKKLVTHFIQVHGARKIAFLRGPDFHRSSLTRLKGYQDALRGASLPLPPEGTLVTDPFNWSKGDAAAAQLFKHRSLVPGRDFDTLIGSSDLMSLEAINYFAKQGYHVLRDYHAGGFNNSVESRLSEIPFTTVHIPYTEWSEKSFRILMKLLGKKKHDPDEEVLLDVKLIIRESCGCIMDRHKKNRAFQLKGDPEAILVKMIVDAIKPDTSTVNARIIPLIHALFHEESDRFLECFEKTLISYFDSGREPEILFNLIRNISCSDIVPATAGFESILYRIFRIRERYTTRTRYEAEKLNTVLNSLKCELLGTRDRNSLVQSLARYLPRIGITSAAIILYRDEKVSICTGSFSPDGLSPVQDQPFPSRHLVPSNLKAWFSNGIFLVQALFIENQPLGYLIHNMPLCDGIIFEELRSAVSYALKGIAQLEDLIRAKRMAEQAERAKTEFLEVLENKLYDPLSEITERLENIEEKFIAEDDRSILPPALLHELRNLKILAATQKVETGSLIDLALARIDELSLRKTLFDPEELLPGLGCIPLLVGDTARLSQCFFLIREAYTGNFSGTLSYEGLELRFQIEKGDIPDQKKPGLLLAERIILMHNGEFHRNSQVCILILPWPSLTRQEASRQVPGPRDHALVISKNISPLEKDGFFDIPLVEEVEKAAELPGRTAFILWNTEDARFEELVKVAGLGHRSEFAEAAFLCYGKEFVGHTSLISAVENAIRFPKKKTILFIGYWEQWDSCWTELGEDIRIPSISVFNETIAEFTPTLIVFNSINAEDVSIVRQHPLTVMVPLIMISDRINSPGDITALNQYSRLLICHRAVSSSPEFLGKVKAIINGDEILPPHTGILVKKAIRYFDKHSESHISRRKLAEAVNVSEDYLTRIFHREMGLSLWDYLNRLRVFMAADLLRQTDRTIQDVALCTGFQDRAYFCRVFKKIYGQSPGQLRKKEPSHPEDLPHKRVLKH